MDDLISRQAAIDAVRSYYDEFDTSDKSIEDRIKALPSAQPNVHDTNVGDIISRQDAIDALGERPMVWAESDYELGARNQYDADVLALETLPSAERKKGRWITKSTNGEMFDVCSACGYVEWDDSHNYCPNCGAEMRGEEDE